MPVENVSVLDDRYVLGDRVGSGGMADVYRATDRVLQRQVAVKVLRETAEGVSRGRFVDEARTLAALSHPGLITLLDAGFSGDHPYLVMELAEGSTLGRTIANGPLPPVEVARIGAAVADALDYAHRAGVVHRDVKPGNVLLPDGGRVLLADFGIARLVGSTEHHTRAGETIGSPAYLAPEQVVGEPLTPAVDVFSLGLVLLEALTGVRAYAGTPIEAALARLSAAPEVPDSLGAEWTGLLVRMTHRDAAARPTAAEVAQALGAWEAAARQAAVERDDDGPDATRVLDLGAVTAPSPLPAAIAEAGAPDATRAVSIPGARREALADFGRDVRDAVGRVGRRVPLPVAAIVVLTVVLVVALVAARPRHQAATSPVTPVPAGVPSGLQGPLGALHHAIEGAP